MTNEQRKEQLRKQFFEFTTLVSGVTIHSEASANQIFNFFYSEIENRDEQIEYHAGLSLKNANAVRELQTKLQRLEEIIKAVDEVIKGFGEFVNGMGMASKVNEALEHYKKLKSKLPSGI